MPDYSCGPTDWDHPDGIALRAEQRVELDTMYGADVEPGAKPTAADVSVFVIARDRDGQAVGCGALRQLDETCAEIKRMFVRPQHRGRNISKLILWALEEEGRKRGWTTLRLETGPLQHAAIALYERWGYTVIDPFGPYVDSEYSICYERVLEPMIHPGR